MAIIRSLEVMNDGYDWIVDLDLEKFFDTVNQDKLIGLIMKTVKDGDVVSLIRKFLVSGVMENGHYELTKVGTPQGGNLSTLLSNIKYILKYKLNRRVPNGTHGGVRGAKLIKS